MLQQSLSQQEEQRRQSVAQQVELQQTIQHLLDARLNSVEAGVAGQAALTTLLQNSINQQDEQNKRLAEQWTQQQELVNQMMEFKGGRSALTDKSGNELLTLTE